MRPTVYNYIHIGNARPAYSFDTVKRYFEYKGYEVNYVSNIRTWTTRLSKRANEERRDIGEIAERYKRSLEGYGDLNVRPRHVSSKPPRRSTT